MPHFARGNALRGKHKPRRRRCRERDCSSSSSSNKDDGAQGRARRRDSDPAPPFRSEQRSRRRRSRAASATSQPFESKENGVAPAARSAFSAAANCRLDDDRCFPPGLAVNTVGLELHPLETCIASAATQQLSSSSASVSGASSPSSSPVTSGRSGSGTVIPMLSLDEEKTVSPSQPARQLKHAASCEHLSRGGVPSQLAGLSPRPLSSLSNTRGDNWTLPRTQQPARKTLSPLASLNSSSTNSSSLFEGYLDMKPRSVASEPIVGYTPGDVGATDFKNRRDHDHCTRTRSRTAGGKVGSEPDTEKYRQRLMKAIRSGGAAPRRRKKKPRHPRGASPSSLNTIVFIDNGEDMRGPL
eukprot:INCI1062.3.p1 GENE.INCI1062.3~~INCI1062.3.p1  ORF type:complete len:356 (-),score=48.52 INCI1062.3:139-1206(-)